MANSRRRTGLGALRSSRKAYLGLTPRLKVVGTVKSMSHRDDNTSRFAARGRPHWVEWWACSIYVWLGLPLMPVARLALPLGGYRALFVLKDLFTSGCSPRRPTDFIEDVSPLRRIGRGFWPASCSCWALPPFSSERRQARPIPSTPPAMRGTRPDSRLDRS